MKFKLVNTSKPVDFEYNSSLPSEYRDEADECQNMPTKESKLEKFSSQSATNVSSQSTTNFSTQSATNFSTQSATKFSGTKFSGTKGQKMNAYKREKYDCLKINLTKGGKDLLKIEAAKRGMSLTKMIKKALREYLNKDQ